MELEACYVETYLHALRGIEKELAAHTRAALELGVPAPVLAIRRSVDSGEQIGTQLHSVLDALARVPHLGERIWRGSVAADAKVLHLTDERRVWVAHQANDVGSLDERRARLREQMRQQYWVRARLLEGNLEHLRAVQGYLGSTMTDGSPSISPALGRLLTYMEVNGVQDVESLREERHLHALEYTFILVDLVRALPELVLPGANNVRAAMQVLRGRGVEVDRLDAELVASALGPIRRTCGDGTVPGTVVARDRPVRTAGAGTSGRGRRYRPGSGKGF